MSTARILVVAAIVMPTVVSAGDIPAEPVEIGFEPQYFVDDYLVDNRWGHKQKSEMVVRVFHEARKDDSNPVIAGKGGYVSVVRDPDGRFKMWYQTSTPKLDEKGDRDGSNYAIAFAESKDGLAWNLPIVGIHEWLGSKENNIVWTGPNGNRASGHQILTVPERDRREHRYIMTYRSGGNNPADSGIRVIGSNDGIHWEKESDSFIHLVHSDTQNSIVYDAKRDEYVMTCRAKDRYRHGGTEMIDTGASRRISRMSGKSIWEPWNDRPQAILTPDEDDAEENFNAFYGMPLKYHAGIYWGALWVFRFNDNIYTELVTSRDGYDFDRAVRRRPLVPLGEEGKWDSYMIFASPDWVEVEDEWWFYYGGWNGPHGTPERDPGIGLARIRKGGLVSLRGPRGGGGVVTRLLVWPGGDLIVNADSSGGELNVRISDEDRSPLAGFDYADRRPTAESSTDQLIRWGTRSLDELAGKVLRIEFSLRDADLYGFSAKRP